MNFLLKELFTTLTREGKLPLIVEEYDNMYSQKEYEVILKEVMISLGMFEDMEPDVTPYESKVLPLMTEHLPFILVGGEIVYKDEIDLK